MNFNKSLVRSLPRGDYAFSNFLEKVSTEYATLQLPKGEIRFVTPNWLTRYRVQTFFTKEPETLEWISGFESDEILWDIGANVGLYSVYAASKGVNVYAFEPSALNIESLTRNVMINGYEGEIVVMPFALTDSDGISTFFMSRENFRTGGAHNSIGEPIDQYGELFSQPLEIRTLSLSVDSCVEILNIEMPTHLKIDVDGCELQVLKGARETLKQVKSVLIEVYPQNKSSGEVMDILKESGLQWERTDLIQSANQIWTRNGRD
jgi:FkbM family methyltransferase